MTVRNPLCRLFVIACLVLGMGQDLRAADGADGRIGVAEAKAVFLYNVVKFVQWPGLPPNRSLVIGLLAFLTEGGHIRLYVEMDRLRFQIDPAGVQLAGLRVSAQLMSLAR